MTVGEKLRALRGGRRREEVAYRIGISVSALQMYEADARKPRDDIKVKLAQLYGVDVQEIFFAEEYTKRGQKLQDKKQR